jgi:hypothetical protein
LEIFKFHDGKSTEGILLKRAAGWWKAVENLPENHPREVLLKEA